MMFLRTERLFLRPAWTEDVPELARAIGHEAVVRMLARAPWPYGEDDARAFVATRRDPRLPALLITLPDEGGRIVGGCGLNEDEGGAEVGYWIVPDRWGRGYASEALCGLVSAARALGHRRLMARHAIDNPASGKVLCKAGFRPTGRSRLAPSAGRGASVQAVEHAIDLGEGGGCKDPAMASPLRCAGYAAGILAAA